MPYEARLIAPDGQLSIVGSASERARLVARGYRDEKPEAVPQAESTPVNDPKPVENKTESKPEGDASRGRQKQ